MRDMNDVKLWMATIAFTETDLDKAEEEISIDLNRPDRSRNSGDSDYYPLFEEKLRAQAKVMAPYYELFYCLENTIRTFVGDRMTDLYGGNWWDGHSPLEVKKNVKANKKREADAGITPRSDSELEYTTFGELGLIVRENWDDFPEIENEKAFTKIMASLNNLRGPIAHCGLLAEDEMIRLRLAFRDWFRLTGSG